MAVFDGVPAIEVTRGGLVESVCTARRWPSPTAPEPYARLGGIEHPIFLRSSAKPFQTMAILETGAATRLSLTQAEVAVRPRREQRAGAPRRRPVDSRQDRPRPERAAVRHACPFSRKVADAYRRAGRPFTPLESNCSGKHAGMLAAALAGGHDTATYLDLAHPSA